VSEDAALLAAIRQAPDDDAPRLIYADWLDEHGQPERAEFIRVQIGLSRKPSRKFRAREAALLKKHYTILAGEFASPGFRFIFTRGFISSFGHSGVFRRIGGENSYTGRGRPPTRIISDSTPTARSNEQAVLMESGLLPRSLAISEQPGSRRRVDTRSTPS